jgi:hypothetical protein
MTGPNRIEWAVAGFVIGLISLDTCLVCETAPEAIDLGYAQHESARGTTERPRGMIAARAARTSTRRRCSDRSSHKRARPDCHGSREGRRGISRKQLGSIGASLLTC